MDNHLSHKVCIAPMMDYTNTHFRYFLRHLSKNIFLYTEMISADAIIHGNREKLLKYHQIEHPIALQIGGSNIEKMTEASLTIDKKDGTSFLALNWSLDFLALNRADF